MVNDFEDSQRTDVNVVYVFDDNYAPIGGTSITSLFENNLDIDEINVYILSQGFSQENSERFSLLSQQYHRNIYIVEIADAVKSIEALGLKGYKGSFVPFIKMCIPEFLPKHIQHMIYLDADTVILGSIFPLLKPVPLLGMVEHSIVSITGKAAGYDAPFNSAVYVINVKRWREENWSERILDFVRRNDQQFLAADEGILNVFCKDEITALPLPFLFDSYIYAFPMDVFLKKNPDFFYSAEETEEAYRNPVVVHMSRFFGEKPWQTNALHPGRKYFDPWVNRSLWNDFNRPPVEKFSLYSLEKWLYVHLPKNIFYTLWLEIQKEIVKKTMKSLNE